MNKLMWLAILTFGLALIFHHKGEKSNTNAEGAEIEPMTAEQLILRGLDITLESIKGKLASTRKAPEEVINEDPGYVGVLPNNEKMLTYANPDGISTFSTKLGGRKDNMRIRGIFQHID